MIHLAVCTLQIYLEYLCMLKKLWLEWSWYVPMLAGYWLFSIPIWVESLKRVSNALILEVNELVWCQFARLLCLQVCKYPPIMHKGCSLEYPTQEPPTPTHYAKGNMSLVITNGTPRMHLMPTHYAKGNMSLVITNGTPRMHLMSTHYAKGNMS